MNDYHSEILADSITQQGDRLITYLVTFPRFLLAELNTHRRFSRNSASSRAIPPEKQIARALDSPFVPATFNERVRGMGIGAEITGEAAEKSKVAWLSARTATTTSAQELVASGVDKSRVNRLLEPFLWHTAIISSTEWENFFALRTDLNSNQPNPDFGAQIEFQTFALLMREQYADSEPSQILPGGFHLPLVNPTERNERDLETAIQLSVSRCARVSFEKHLAIEDTEKTIARYHALKQNGHLSPFEHVARPFTNEERQMIAAAQDVAEDYRGSVDTEIVNNFLSHVTYCGNFQGWVQHRKYVPGEHNHLLSIAADTGTETTYP